MITSKHILMALIACIAPINASQKIWSDPEQLAEVTVLVLLIQDALGNLSNSKNPTSQGQNFYENLKPHLEQSQKARSYLAENIINKLKDLLNPKSSTFTFSDQALFEQTFEYKMNTYPTLTQQQVMEQHLKKLKEDLALTTEQTIKENLIKFRILDATKIAVLAACTSMQGERGEKAKIAFKAFCDFFNFEIPATIRSTWITKEEGLKCKIKPQRAQNQEQAHAEKEPRSEHKGIGTKSESEEEFLEKYNQESRIHREQAQEPTQEKQKLAVKVKKPAQTQSLQQAQEQLKLYAELESLATIRKTRIENLEQEKQKWEKQKTTFKKVGLGLGLATAITGTGLLYLGGRALQKRGLLKYRR